MTRGWTKHANKDTVTHTAGQRRARDTVMQPRPTLRGVRSSSTHPPSASVGGHTAAHGRRIVRTRRRASATTSERRDGGSAAASSSTSPTRSAPRIVVPPPTCPPPNNNSVWFTRGTQSIKSGAATVNGRHSHSPARHPASACGAATSRASPRPPAVVSCTWARPPPAVVVACGTTGAADNGRASIVGRWSEL